MVIDEREIYVCIRMCWSISFVSFFIHEWKWNYKAGEKATFLTKFTKMCFDFEIYL